MRRGFSLAAILALLLGAGCADVVGRWSLTAVEPPAARPDFSPQAMTLERNGTYSATDPQRGPTTGRWYWGNDRLVLDPAGGERTTYGVAQFDGSTLKLTYNPGTGTAVGTYQRGQ